MKNLEDFRNIHEGQDIYVIGSGFSCEFIDPDFFANKITIGINQVYKKFKTTYVMRKEHKDFPKIMSEHKDATWFISLHNCGANCYPKLDKTKYEETQNLCIYDHTNNTNPGAQITTVPDNALIASFSTITTGIHLAAYMGAKNIILVGHDCGTIDDKCNFTGYHTKDTLFIWKNGEDDYKKWLPKIEGQTIALKKLLKAKYGCNVYSLNPFINFGLEGHVYKKG